LSFFATPNTALIEYITYHLLPRCSSIVLQSLLLPSGSPAITVNARDKKRRAVEEVEVIDNVGASESGLVGN
jgi:hypothetical protein